MSVNICPPDHRHGVVATCYYHHGCRCESCRANRRGRLLRDLAGPDPMAVELAVDGVQVEMTVQQRAEAVRRLWWWRWSDGAIAERLRITDRTVWRIRQRVGLPAWQMHELERTKQLERKSA